ncbi:Leucine-rich repeat domain [Pacmanvirus A23]|uniref:Leucine-rich repeat domain n=1 Tax=Pacmanvirus A23 TaxID=1932881 RepID=UPI000A09382D|nr:Leucine-rich repeat domain [Pacmanvirus A23]SIP86170.1 Leucine-rich repeat domain [Pacmanvirus A23]
MDIDALHEMNIVLKRLNEMKNGFLVIRNLNLREKLPESPKWAEVTYLDCSKNHLSELPDLPNVVELYCTENNLSALPKLPKIKRLFCSCNKIIILPELSNVVDLHCAYNKLTTLPELPNVKVIICFENKIVRVPELPNIEIFDCGSNQIAELPLMLKLRELNCSNNKMTVLPKLHSIGRNFNYENTPLYYNPKFNKIHYAIIDFVNLKIYVDKWRKFNQLSVSTKKEDLHNELLYSPDLPFHKRTEEYQHWHQNTNL